MKNKTIYIQHNEVRPYNHECSCALHGAVDLELDYIPAYYNDLKNGHYDHVLTSNLFVGTVEFMNEVFRRIGLDSVRLPKNSNRESKIMTLDEARALITPEKSLFIKPVAIKLFTGFVLDESHYACLDDVPGNTLVYTYPPFRYDIVSEWRVYINDREVELCTNYSGDPLRFINKDSLNYYLDECINYEPPHKFPKTFTIDIAVFDQEHEFDKVIEYNDMWGIGNYGLNNDIYVEMLYKRYFEIIEKAPLPKGNNLIIERMVDNQSILVLDNIDIEDWDKNDIYDLYNSLGGEEKNLQFSIKNYRGKLIKLNL